MPSLSITSQFGVIHCEFDEAVVGVDANACETHGAVTRVWITSESATTRSATSALGQEIEESFHSWLQGTATALDGIGVRQNGTQFQQSVWQAMRSIRPGNPVAYSVLAAMAGNAGAVRATASTCARNQIPLIVPCHRVINADGSIGRYSAGETGFVLKQALLRHELAV